ncbi:MAG: PadR family transcriptional regulator [Oscillospiraceae bacterium]|nr:PadR family transcriptional regulator [Oscillospiraceae bacterium]
MRELKYTILGLVQREPASGYDIAKTFSDSVSNFWSAKHSQIYPELKRLVEEGLVEYRIEIQGEKLEKKMYSITEKGREEFFDWLYRDDGPPPQQKDAFRLRIYFNEDLSQEKKRELLNAQCARRWDRLLELEQMTCAFPPVEEMSPAQFSDHLLIRGGVLREEAYIQWLYECAAVFGVTIDDQHYRDLQRARREQRARETGEK